MSKKPSRLPVMNQERSQEQELVQAYKELSSKKTVSKDVEERMNEIRKRYLALFIPKKARK